MNIQVIGAGYVGLAAVCCLADTGDQVTCVEADKHKRALLKRGSRPIYEKAIDRLLR